MAYPVTLNGRTYTLADFEGNNYVDGLPDAFEDFVTHAGDIYNDTSTTSNSIGTGSKTFTVASGKPYQAGTPLRIADAAAPATNFLDAVVTSYSGTTLVVEAIGYGGSGTKTSWTVNIGGAKTIDGTLGVSQGGTGATTAAAARTNLETYSKTEADSRFLNVSGEASDVTMTGNVTIGDAAGDTLTVNATADFNTGFNVDGTVTSDGLTVAGNLSVDGGTIKLDGDYPVGANNVALGSAALDSVEAGGNNNTAIGFNAGTAITTGDNSVAVGTLALASNTTGANNIGIGVSALNSNTTGGQNVAVGDNALGTNTTGLRNTAVGFWALRLSTGEGNTAVGYGGLGQNTGAANTAIGRSALTANTTASNNTAVGYQTLYSNTTASSNTAFGYQAGYSNTTGAKNVAIGDSALKSSTTASNSLAIGYRAGRLVTTGNNNVYLGYTTGQDSTVGGSNVAIGTQALNANEGGSKNVAIGTDALQTFNPSASVINTYNVAIGYEAMHDASTGTTNTALGSFALRSNTTASHNTAVGYFAGYSVTTGLVSAFGSNVLKNNSTGSYNTGLGGRGPDNYSSLNENTTGSYNVAVGHGSLARNTTADNNTAVGYQAGYSNTTGRSNTFIGDAAGNASTSSFNTYIGKDAGKLITSGEGNTILGSYNGNQGGLDIRTSSNNIVLSDGDGNPRLYIDSSGYIMNSNAISGMDLGFGQQHFSVKTTDGSSAAIFGNTTTSTSTTLTYASSTSYVGNMMDNRVGRTQNSGFNFEIWRSGGNADTEFKLRGDGQAYADGSWNGGGADYAEYFEWDDGNTANEDRRGFSVVLINNKLRKATADDDAGSIIGVVSGNPSVVGDTDMDAWKHKYLRDDFGTYQRDENGERILNPDYDPDQEYTSREDRPEWDTVGLMGKLRIRKGQPTGSNWIKMRNVSDTVEEWLVR